VLGYW